MKTLILLLLSVCAVYGGKCPDGSSCGDSETCCATSFGGYGCCPMASAVCCTDGQHCCPANTQCDLEHQQCISQNLIPFLEKREPFQLKKIQASDMLEANKVDVVYCPGGQYYCPDGNTCCLLVTGQYGCCPYPSAMCCNDRVHCCPAGTRCDATSQYCLQGQQRFPMLAKRPAMLVK